MDKKKVSFNIQTAVCGVCHMQSSDSEADDSAAREAVVFCKTCGLFLCATCLKPHRKLVVTENHQLLNRDHVIAEDDKEDRHYQNEANGINGELAVLTQLGILSAPAIREYERYRATLMERLSKGFTDDTLVGDVSHAEDTSSAEQHPVNEHSETQHNFTELCSVHSDQFLKFYCEEHKQLCCESCRNEHKACFAKMKFIPDEARHFENVNPPFKKINGQINDLKDYEKKLQHDLKELKKSKETFLFDLRNKKREILNWLNLMEVRAVRRLEIVFDKCKREIERKRQSAKAACEELRAEVYFLKEITRNDKFDNIYKYIKIKQADLCVEAAVKKKGHRQFTNTRFGMKVNEDFAKAQRDAEQLYEICFEKKGETKFNIRLKDDKQVCNITGCAMLPSGGVALADRNNANVKVFNSQFKLTALLNVLDGLFDLTCIGHNSLAATSPLKSRINIIEIQPETEIVKAIQTGTGSCWGVKHHEGIFVVNCSTTDSSFIRAVDLDSNILFEVETKCNFYSEISFHDETKTMIISAATCYIDGSDTKIVHYIDEHDIKLHDSTKVLEYNFLNHLKTKGVTSDNHRNLIVCCKDTDQIYTIANAGNEAELLLAETEGLQSPQALCFNENKSKLLVTSENTNYIQIFEFTP